MKDCTTCKYGFVDEQFGFPMCHHPLRFAKDCVDFNMHEEIEEPEKATGTEEKKLPEGLEEAAENYIAPIENDEGLDYINFNGRDIKDAFIAGAEWMKAKMLKLIEARISEIIGDAQPNPVLRMELQGIIDKIK